MRARKLEPTSRSNTRPTLILLLLCALIASGCLRFGPRREKVRIGVFISLTGSTADYGLSTINGIRMAAEEVNSAGGLDGRQIELLIEDTRSTDYGTSVAVRRLVHE